MGSLGAGGSGDPPAGHPDFAGNQPPPSSPPITVTLGQIPEILSRFDDEKRQHTISAIRKMRDEAEPFVEELMRMGRDLEQDSLDVDSIDRHLAIIVVRGKKQVIDVIRRGVAPLPGVDSIEDATSAESALRQLLKKVGDVMGRQTRVIHIFAKKHANHFKDTLEAMNARHTRMRHIMDRHNQATAESDEIKDALKSIAKLQESRSKKSQKVRDLSSSIESLGSRLSQLESAISEIKSSRQYQEYTVLLSNIKECDSQLARIREDIRLQFAKISRPLGRYEYGSALDKEQQKVLAGLVADPAAVVTPGNISTISTIILNVRRAVATESISVRDVEKMLAMLAETAEAVGPLADRLAECDERRRKLQDRADSARSTKLDECEHGVSKATALRKDSESRLSALRAELEDDNSRIARMVSDMQIGLRQYTGVKYEVEAH